MGEIEISKMELCILNIIIHVHIAPAQPQLKKIQHLVGYCFLTALVKLTRKRDVIA